jgi:hypothetical protein
MLRCKRPERNRKGRKVWQRNRNKRRLPHPLPAKVAKADRLDKVDRADKLDRVVQVDTVHPAGKGHMEAAVAARAVPVEAGAKADRVVPAALVDRVVRAAASASISARKRSASSVSRKWTSSTTSAPTFFHSSCRNAAKFCLAA